MKKKKKERPRENDNILSESTRSYIFNEIRKELNTKTLKYKNEKGLDILFHLCQDDNNPNELVSSIFNLAYFYDENFLGNKDFIHIPAITQVANNMLKYPVILASRKELDGSNEILGATTLKMENNNSITKNPYFPTKNQNVLSITGVLSKPNIYPGDTKVRGIGKELYKSSIKSAIEVNKEKNIRLICEIDVRNTNSFNSICNAVRELNEEGTDVQIFIAGYYEIFGKDKSMVEAPTFILELDLDGTKSLDDNHVDFSYLDCDLQNLYNDLSLKVRNLTKENKRYINMKNFNTIVYHSIKPINALNVSIEVGLTAEGNDRKRELSPIQVEYVNS